MSAITLEACHAADLLEQAFKRYGPDTVNTDQGSQFNAKAFVDAVKGQGCLLSMDGLGAWRDNLFVERLWRSVKYERVCLHTYDSAGQARASILDYFECYNHERPHSSLKRKAPHIRRITKGYQPSSWPPKPWQGFHFKSSISCSKQWNHFYTPGAMHFANQAQVQRSCARN
jgi:putative transposase